MSMGSAARVITGEDGVEHYNAVLIGGLDSTQICAVPAVGGVVTLF